MSESVGGILQAGAALAPLADPTGITLAIFTIIGLFLGIAEHPEQPNNHHQTAFRLHLGLDSWPGEGKGGEAPDVRVWDERGNWLGAAWGDSIEVVAGDFIDMNVDLKEPHQPTYALFTANDNDVCLAYVTQTLATGEKYSWSGQWAQTCSKPWYWSNVVYDGHDDLACAWIAKREVDNRDITAIQLHMHEFKYTDDHNKSLEYFCEGNPSMKFYKKFDQDEIDWWETHSPENENSTRPILHAGGNSDFRPRSIRRSRSGSGSLTSQDTVVPTPRISRASGPSKPSREYKTQARPPKPPQGSWLVKSRRGQSAAVLCADKASRGPDFVSYSEGRFCNMDTRELLPLCGTAGLVADCFDDEANVVRRSGEERGDVLDQLGYDKVEEWH